MPETTVSPDLLEPLQIFSQLVVQTVGKDLRKVLTTIMIFAVYVKSSNVFSFTNLPVPQVVKKWRFNVLITTEKEGKSGLKSSWDIWSFLIMTQL